MTDKPVNLDACRSPDDRSAAHVPAGICPRNNAAPKNLVLRPISDTALPAQLLAGPADTWPRYCPKDHVPVGPLCCHARRAGYAGANSESSGALFDITRLTRTQGIEIHEKPVSLTRPIPQRRRAMCPPRAACLRCKAMFQSEGFGERICPRCKGSSVRKSAPAPARHRDTSALGMTDISHHP